MYAAWSLVPWTREAHGTSYQMKFKQGNYLFMQANMDSTKEIKGCNKKRLKWAKKLSKR
jgi:hypothetical protein